MHIRAWRSRLSVLAVGAALSFLVAGCDNTTGPIATPSPGLTECGAENIFHRGNFSNPTAINNRFFPLVPGTQYILDGVANRGGGLLPHRVVFTVTDVTKVIDGVSCVVLWDRDYNNSQLAEAELAFFAQDNEGNVWSTGEYPEEYENGEFVGAPSTWVAGLADAEAGVHMSGAPRVGLKFMQGFAPNIN